MKQLKELSNNKGVMIVLLPLISGVVYGCAWNFDELFFLQVMSLVPFFFSVDYIKKCEAKVSKKIRYLLVVVLFFKIPIDSIVLIWMFNYSFVALGVLWCTDFVLFSLVLIPVLIKKMPLISVVFALALFELLMQVVPTLVPFYQLGYSWGDFPYLIQYYAIFGVEGGSLVLYLVNFAVFKWVQQKKSNLFSTVTLIGFGMLTLVSVLDFYLSSPVQLSQNEKISVIHCDFYSKDSVYRANPIRLIDSVVQVAAPHSLVVLPEVFFNNFGWLGNIGKSKIVEHIDSIGKANDQEYLFGAYLLSVTKHPTPQSRYYKPYNLFYNAHNVSIFLDHKIIGIKSKRKFIPFFEYVPNNSFAQWINAHISTIGDDRKVTILPRDDNFTYKQMHFNTILCYESVYPMFVANHAKNQQFIVIQANEKWNTSPLLSKQYFKVNKVNTIQVGLPTYRTSNTGFSAIISPKGNVKEVYNSSSHFSLLEGNLPKMIQAAFYCTIVGWSYWLSGIILFVLFVRSLLYKRM